LIILFHHFDSTIFAGVKGLEWFHEFSIYIVVILCEHNFSEVVGLIAFMCGWLVEWWSTICIVEHIILPFWFYKFCRCYGTFFFNFFMHFQYSCPIAFIFSRMIDHIIPPFWYNNFCRSYGTLIFSSCKCNSY
jgi:hypothetical protein